MCGRYATSRSSADLSALFDADDETEGGLEPDYNVAPTDPVPVVRVSRSASVDGTGARVLSRVRWGLVPAYAKDTKGGARLINARAETVTKSGAFSASFQKRRCLVPADGFYEWRKAGKQKQPWRFHLADNGPFCFAGLWDSWCDPETKTELESFTIITTEANELLAPIHNRMPVMLAKHDLAAWLEGTNAAKLLRPYPAEEMRGYPVSTMVNSWRNETPDCFAPAGEEKTAATSS
jgi:putative SOS response-associated peptidase YedK